MTSRRLSGIWDRNSGAKLMIRSPVKQHIRSRYGSIKAFELAKGLRPYAVRDYLRGRSILAAERAVMAECGPHDLEQPRLKRRRLSSELVERERAIRACEHRLEELAAALERAVQALETLKGLEAPAE